ncbi:gasdermin-A-like [Pseudopipra pipra]|uniref:gasdermin-A-like n=1 Tax=Pseudopipra pipra TaxID=415032 RepID=UPI0031394504
MFKKVTKYIVSQMDPKEELVPVDSIVDHEHFRPLCLLTKKRKRKTIFHSRPFYECTRFSLNSVLLPGEDGDSTESLLPSGDGPDYNRFTLITISADKVKSDISVSAEAASVEVNRRGSLSQAFSIKLQKKAISMDLLEAVRKKRKINMDHSFIQDLKRNDIDLFLVYETLEASEETIYRESSKAQGGFLATIYAKFSAQGRRENTQSIAMPKGCTLAFRAIQMKISKGEWALSHFKEEGSGSASVLLAGFSFSRPPDIVDTEVKQYYETFSKLPSDQRAIFLNTITAVMRDRNLFQELSQKMEAVLEKTDGFKLKTESPDLKNLLSTLENSPRNRLLLAEGITYTLDALAELLDNQLALLLESLERKIVSQQLQLVEKLVKHKQMKQNKPFRVSASLLSFPRREDQTLTMALVELSRVKLREDGSAVPIEWPFELVAALYVALYALNLLSGPK